jgi:hypothetical protein
MDNLMSSPRNSPTFIGDIYPHGNLDDQLTGTIGGNNWGNDIGPIEGSQIDRARAMPIAIAGSYPSYVYAAVPEPATTTAIAGSIML